MVELDAIVAAVFPKLVDVFHAGLADVQGNVVMLRLCCKIYYSVTYMDMPNSLDTRPWMEGLFMLAAVNVETRDVGHPWWKLKKWLFSTMYRYFSIQCRKDTERVVGMMDPAPVCMRILQTTVSSLSLYSQGHFLSPRVANTLLNILDEAVRKPKYWSEIQPHISQVCNWCPQVPVSTGQLTPEGAILLSTIQPTEIPHKHALPHATPPLGHCSSSSMSSSPCWLSTTLTKSSGTRIPRSISERGMISLRTSTLQKRVLLRSYVAYVVR